MPERVCQRDQVEQTLEQLSRFAEILRPEDVDEPILVPTVARAVYEWLIELNDAQALADVKIEPRRLALLYGPPGTGKTTLAHHVAARLGLPLVAVQSERLVDAWLGSTGKNIAAVFDLLKSIDRSCVMLLDEFDAIAQKRLTDPRGGATQERNQSLAVLLGRIEAFRGVGLAATNTKDALDPAMWRRFGLQISLDLPGEPERFAILRKYALPFDLEDGAIDMLVSVTRGCSPSLLRQLMEGMKRTLVLGPRLRFDTSRPAAVFAHVVTSIAPPPQLQEPPLWSDGRSVDRLQAIPWPPKRLGPHEAR